MSICIFFSIFCSCCCCCLFRYANLTRYNVRNVTWTTNRIICYKNEHCTMKYCAIVEPCIADKLKKIGWHCRFDKYSQYSVRNSACALGTFLMFFSFSWISTTTKNFARMNKNVCQKIYRCVNMAVVLSISTLLCRMGLQCVNKHLTTHQTNGLDDAYFPRCYTLHIMF